METCTASGGALQLPRADPQATYTGLARQHHQKPRAATCFSVAATSAARDAVRHWPINCLIIEYWWLRGRRRRATWLAGEVTCSRPGSSHDARSRRPKMGCPPVCQPAAMAAAMNRSCRCAARRAHLADEAQLPLHRLFSARTAQRTRHKSSASGGGLWAVEKPIDTVQTLERGRKKRAALCNVLKCLTESPSRGGRPRRDG